MIRMRHLACCTIVLLTGASVRADRKPDLTPVQQVFKADLVVIGKVVSLEADLVEAVPYPNNPKIGHQVGSIKIADGLLGAKGLTHARVGFIPRLVDPNAERFKRGYRGVDHNLTVEQEGCFFLQKHPDADFYTQIPFGSMLNKKIESYEKELENLKKVVKILDEPMTALKATAVADRQLAACALITRYRSRYALSDQMQSSEAIPAEESKLIMQTLAGMEWNKFNPDGISNLNNVFHQIGLTANDGWVEPKPKNGQDYNKIMGEAVAKWLKDHAETYRIQRITVVTPSKK